MAYDEATATIAAHANTNNMVTVTGITELPESLRTKVAESLAQSAIDGLHGTVTHGYKVGNLVGTSADGDTLIFAIQTP